jgi:hyaluronoglucosaminidase
MVTKGIFWAFVCLAVASCGNSVARAHRAPGIQAFKVPPLAQPVAPAVLSPTTAYVTLPDLDQIVPVTLSTLQPGAPFQVRQTHPDPVAVSSDGAVVVAGSFPPHLGGHQYSITVIDTRTGHVSYLSPPGDHPSSVAFGPDGHTAWITMWRQGTIVPLDTSTMAFGTPIKVGGYITGIAITHDGRFALVADFGSDVGWIKGKVGRTIRVVDLRTHKVSSPITVGPQPCDFAINATDTVAYVTVSGSDRIVPIDLQTLRTMPAITVAEAPEGIALSPDGRTLYLTAKGAPLMSPNLGYGSLQSVDLATGAVTTILERLDDPWSVVLSPDGSTAYVTNTDASSLSVVDLSTRSVRTVTLGSRTHAVALGLG